MFENKPIFGMVHMAPGPMGTPARAMREMRIMQSNGVDGVILENYHGSTTDILETLMDMSGFKIKIGVNVLPNDFERAFKLAGNFYCDFIQMDYISGKYNRCTKLDVSKYKSLRKQYPRIKVLGGVWPKYYYPVNGSVLEDDIKEAMDLCDAIVVTGSGTGKETPLEKIKKFREICGDFPLIVGAGLNPKNVKEQLSIADGGIVGSTFKPLGDTTAFVDHGLVEDFMKAKNGIS